MARYIDEENLIRRMHTMAADIFKSFAFKVFKDLLMSEPTADVQEVKHGTWETYEEEVYGIVPTEFKVCSKCGKEYNSVFMSACCADFEKDTIEFHYCPWCGAKMGKKGE